MIGELPAECRMLKRLFLNNVGLNDATSHCVQNLIESAEELVELHLSHNELREIGGVLIGDSLSKCNVACSDVAKVECVVTPRPPWLRHWFATMHCVNS